MTAPATNKPTIIGLYGISGCGKSYLLKELNKDDALKEQHFTFHDGSELIASVTPGGLETFKQLIEADQKVYIAAALNKVSKGCQDRQETAVITGHHLFWNPEKEEKARVVSTEKDWKIYTHIVYLNVEPGLVAKRGKDDTSRTRPDLSVADLTEWQNAERTSLRRACRENKVLYTSIDVHTGSDDNIILLRLKNMLKDFRQHTEAANISAIDAALETALHNQDGLEKVLLLDGDKTLAPCDTGSMFWKVLKANETNPDPLKELFTGQGYSYASFRQATLLYEEKASIFDVVCDDVADEVEMYPEMIALLDRVAKETHTRAVVVTCGLRRVWESVLKRNNLSHVSVIGGGRLADGYVVTGEVKGHIVDKLHDKKLRVLAFGDSPLDIDMLAKANQAFVVVGDKASRSKSMDEALATATVKGLSAHQVILPATAEPRANLARLDLDDDAIKFLLRRSFIHATPKNARKLLQTPTRDSKVASHDLRKAHERMGFYLATEYVSAVLDVEEYAIPHVQGGNTDGYRYLNEASTLIVPLMRGGEPMAFGVSKALKLASFAHARAYSDIKKGLLDGKQTIILVDSVINSGKSIMEFMTPLRAKYPDVRVVVMAGVVQANAVIDTALGEQLDIDANFTLVALRKSDNAFKGSGVTDTGDRLFNTTYLVDK
ncbi:hypothetical protein CC86DRAFT_340779 [Ophiobolus disseminans]|uniref:Phosphoribosyltransferase domain-containing protein n=1 Tax=Ophiobolus disseminans TaxID=1469910 RepID=A0A6A7AI21_9PLEO|nr:hypothetical protein CC86DRAFT_340779 [Ophiobolus disseminans]